jgi:lipoate-protein ligase A
VTAEVVAAGLVPAPEGLALDEALVRVPPAGPLLATWRAHPAVVVGRFQRIDWEIAPDACAARGVRAWRRFSGGGAVYLDPGVVCATLVVPAGHPDARLGVPDMYAPFLAGMARACRALGLAAEADERTVRVGGRKVTGVAAHRGRAATLVHGTLLVAADLDALSACLAGPRGGPQDGTPRPAMSRPDRVANVGGTVEAAEAAIVETFAPGATPGPPGSGRREAMAGLLASRYRDRAWHAGPWAAVTPEAADDRLGGR